MPQTDFNHIPTNRTAHRANHVPRRHSNVCPVDYFYGAKFFGTILIIIFICRFLYRYVYPFAYVLFKHQEIFTMILGIILPISIFIKFRLWEKLSLKILNFRNLNIFQELALTAAFFLFFPATLIFLNLLGSSLLFLQGNQGVCVVVNVTIFVINFIIIKMGY